MIYPVHADLIPLLRNLTEALQPFAAAQFVALRFECNRQELTTTYHPEELIPDLTQLLCRVVTFTPQNHSVVLQATLIGSQDSPFLQLCVVNTGSNLALLTDINAGLKHPVQVTPVDEKGTSFELSLPMEPLPKTMPEATSDLSRPNKPLLKQFYDEMRKRLSSHFSDPVNMERAVSGRSPREGAFLQKVNAILLAHIDDEHFDVKRLCKSLALSRTQLYRRLCPLIRQTPARYIRLVRLQRAKELLEEGELAVGDIALHTGFQSQSHFTRIFTEHYGVKPSAFRRPPKPKT